jgi:SRSO17 transposase
MALAAGVPPRTLQQFLERYHWDHEAVRRRIQELVAKQHAAPNGIALIDETSFGKKGDKTVGVQRQWCGSRGKKDNCVVTVHLGYAAGDFHALVDSDLYLPKETWHEDRERCRAAYIPDQVVYRPKWRIALELLDRAMHNGVRFKYLVGDEAYGGVPDFRDEVAQRGLVYVLEVPRSTAGWVDTASFDRRCARGRIPHPKRVDTLWKRGGPSWQRFHVKNTDKGPEVWEARVVRFIPGPNGIPREPCWLLVARHVLTGEMKYFLSNAPADTAPELLLHVAFSRWHIERLFEDGKSHIGLDHFEVRNYQPVIRHLILSMLSLLFLVQQTHRLREKKSPLDRAPSPDGHRSAA